MTSISSPNNISSSPIKKIKKKKSHCKFGTCTEKFSIAVGFCKWCEKYYCLKCRHPEAHNCINLQDCKNAAKDKNSKLISAEKSFLHKKLNQV